MYRQKQRGRINVKLLVILILVTLALGISLVAARQVRREILSEAAMREGQAAYEREDWRIACKHFRDYLGSNPEDLNVLKKYAEAQASIRPMDAGTIHGAIVANRRILQLDPLDEDSCERLATLYAGIGNFDELVHIAKLRLTHDPNDRQAPLWLANGLTRLGKTEQARGILESYIEQLEPVSDESMEYVRACVGMSETILAESPDEGKAVALTYLDRAVKNGLPSAEARLARARFLARVTNTPGMSAEERLDLARQDLQAADQLDAANPQILLLLGREWLAHGELDNVEAELHKAEAVKLETVQEHFFDSNDWRTGRYSLGVDLARRRGENEQALDLANEALTVLRAPRHRVQILPSAIRLSVDANEVTDARAYLNEYQGIVSAREDAGANREQLTYLQAIVAKSENTPYKVIDKLQPIVVNEGSRPELWALLAEAYIRTDQTRRAVGALRQYLKLRPNDSSMTLQLARLYLKLRDWQLVFKTAQAAEKMDTEDLTAALLRIEAGIHLATDSGTDMDAARLAELSTELNELARLHPNRHEVYGMLAGISEYSGRVDEAEQILKRAIEAGGTSVGPEIQLVRYYRRNDRLTDAVALCRSVCERHSDSAEPWIQLSQLCMAESDYDGAHDCLERGIATVTKKSEQRRLSINLASLEIAEGGPEARKAGIQRLVNLAEQNEREIQARTLLLKVREVREDQKLTTKLIDELKQIEGDSGLLWRLHQASLWLASADWRSRQVDIADYLDHCMASDPSWVAPVLLSTDLYDKLGDVDRVESICRQALGRNPSAMAIANRLLVLLEKQGRFQEAAEVLDDIGQSSSSMELVKDWTVRIAVRTGQLSQAIDELKLRVSNNTRDINSRIQLARLIYQERQDLENAFAYLDQAEAIAPTALGPKAARVSILAAEGRAEEARSILDEFVAETDSFAAYMMRAEYFSDQGAYELAQKDYEKLTTFTGNRAAGYGLLSDFYIRNQRFDAAIDALEAGLADSSEDSRLKRRLMQVLFARGADADIQRGLHILHVLQQDSPEDTELMKLRATQELNAGTSGSIETGRETLETVIRLKPTDIEAHLMLIRMSLHMRDYEEARNLTIRALGAVPDSLALQSIRGRVELMLQNNRMAAQLAEQVLAEDPNHTEARDVFVQAALASADRSLLGEANTLLDDAIENSPYSEGLLLSRARILVALEQPAVAIPQLEAYCQSDETDPTIAALITLADLHRMTGDAARAESIIQRAAEMEPGSQRVVHARLLLLMDQDRTAELSDIASAYISAAEQNPGILIAAATTLSTMDSIKLKKEALRLYEHTAKLFPESIPAHLGSASTMYQLGDVDAAKRAYRDVLKQHPDNVQALNDLAWILQERDADYADALELAEKGLSIAPNDRHLLDTRGTILSRMAGHLDDAKRDFEKLLSLSQPNSSQRAKAHMQLGRINNKLGDNRAAEEHFDKAMGIDQAIDVLTPAEKSEIMMMTRQSGM